MRPSFSDAIAETREEFLNQVRNSTATFYEVYSGTPSIELEAVFDDLQQGEIAIRFDMCMHSNDARDRFCRLSDLERRAYRFSANTTERPLPYFGAYVPGIGYTGIAWTSNDIIELILRTRQDEVRAKEVADQIERSRVV